MFNIGGTAQHKKPLVFCWLTKRNGTFTTKIAFLVLLLKLTQTVGRVLQNLTIFCSALWYSAVYASCVILTHEATSGNSDLIHLMASPTFSLTDILIRGGRLIVK